MRDFDPADHYWFVGGDESRAWSSAARAYVPAADSALRARIAEREVAAATRIASEAELWEVLARIAPDTLPATTAAQDALKQRRINSIDAVQFRIHFRHENRLRALEGEAALTPAQFRAALLPLV